MIKEHQVINKEELKKIIKIKGCVGNMLASTAMRVLHLSDLNKMYNAAYNDDCAIFVDNCLKYGNNQIAVSQTDLNGIPKTGPLIFLFNHPYGGLDALVIIKTILSVRPDMKFVANFMLSKVKPLDPYLLKVNPFEGHKGAFSSTAGLKEMYKHLGEGKCLCIFPAGEVSSYQKKSKKIEDRDWPNSIVKFLMRAKAPLISGFVSGENSSLFYRLGKIHPMLRTLRLPTELVNKQNRTVEIRFSGALPLKSIRQINDPAVLGKLLKARTYALKNQKKEIAEVKVNAQSLKEIIAPVDKSILTKEIEKIQKTDSLFISENYECFFSNKKEIPAIFEEITRLRELTFREVGEGTGEEKDLDEYDTYYKHLFIWDHDESVIVGAYRIGMGADIIEQKGVDGFYVGTLFKIDEKFQPYLVKSMEMGRSFISINYQRRPLPLFLLWKGIYSVTQKYPDYKYLIGPVSISSIYSHNSIALIIEHIKRYHSSAALEALIDHKTPFEYELNEHIEAIIENAGDNLNSLDRTIRDLDSNRMGIPILIKKYISVGGKIVSFNVDPEFNNSVDGFVVVDIEQLSQEVIDTYK